MLHSLLQLKIYFDRGRSYQNYISILISIVILINTTPLLRTFKNNYVTLALMFLGYICVVLAIGYIDARLKIREKETKILNSYVTQKLDEIHKMLKTLR